MTVLEKAMQGGPEEVFSTLRRLFSESYGDPDYVLFALRQEVEDE